MQDLSVFFEHLNNVAFPYVVMRNWENLPHNVETGIHSDLDLLLYDLEHFLELFPDLEREHPAPRVRFKLTFDDGRFIFLDARSVGDGYYPEAFQEAMLKTREWNGAGFWTPNPIHHRIGLAYHVVHHKNGNTYPNYLGPASVGKLLDSLKQNEDLAWVEPDDPSVGRFNSYMNGGTSAVSVVDGHIEKTQTRYKKYDLVENEERMLKAAKGVHFPKLLSRDDRTLRIEHCGEPLGAHNVPDNWLQQLEEILEELDSCGIVHRDVRLDNLMVRDGTVRLVDFGWARLKGELDGKHPDLLGYPNRCPLGFNDRYSMSRIIKHLQEELEDSCQTAS